MAIAALATWFTEALSPTSRTERRIRQLVEISRPARGALYGFAYAPQNDGGSDQSLTISEGVFHARTIKDSRTRRRLMATLQIMRGSFEDAALNLEDLQFQYPDDAGIANDLGVAYLELASSKSAHLRDALAQFVSAWNLDPGAPEISFNLALAWAQLQLPAEAAGWVTRSRDLDRTGRWSDELLERLSAARSSDGFTDIETYSRTVSWEEAVDEPQGWWEALTDALRNPFQITWTPELERLLVGHEERFNDRSPRAILEPLPSANDHIAEIRAVVGRAEDEQFTSSERALATLDTVRDSVAILPSDNFDRLRWQIVRSENAFRVGGTGESLRALDDAVREARNANYMWLYGHGLESLAGALGAGDQLTLIERNRQAFDTLAAIGAAHDAMRAMSTLGVLTWFEGDWETSLGMSLDTLALAPESDHRRRFTALEVLAQNPLLDEPTQLAYVELLLETAAQIDNDALANALALAARIHAVQGDFEAAEGYIERVGKITAGLPSLAAFHLGFAQARVQAERRVSEESFGFFRNQASALENRGLNAYTHPIYLEWAEAHRRIGDRAAAARLLDEALESVDRLNEQVGRLHFDPVRRNVYETVIGFQLEDDHSMAWHTVQEYRTKLDATILPQFGGVPLHTNPPVDVPAVDDRTVLEYTILHDRLLIWVISGGRLRYQEIPLNRDDLTEEVQRYLHHLARPDLMSELSELGQALYEKLVGPVRQWLEPGKPLVIIPDRILHRLPFAALPSRDGRFLVEDFTIAEAPTLVRALHDPPEWSETPRMLAVGPQYPSIAMWRELDAIERFYPSIETMGSQATRESFLAESRGASMLHVTGHSAVDGASGLTSAILLDGVDGPNRITASDVAGLELDGGSLVVLASCDSSVGNTIGGIGVRGLTSAFMAAGAGAVAGSLWPVEDESTGRLMTAFHQFLIDGETVAGALRRAQLDFIEDGRHPYEWAGFTVTGDRTTTRPIPLATPESDRATEAAAIFP